MANNKKPRKAYKPKALANPIHSAIMRASTLTDPERATLLDPLRAIYDDLRAGKLTNAQFKHIADCFNIAQALTGPGFGLLPDHADKFDTAQEALGAIAARRSKGGSWTCYAQELADIDTAIEFHEYQLAYVSVGELARATKIVDDFLRSTKGGDVGKRHIHTILVSEAA